MSLAYSGPFLRLSVLRRLSGTNRELLCKDKKQGRSKVPFRILHIFLKTQIDVIDALEM